MDFPREGFTNLKEELLKLGNNSSGHIALDLKDVDYLNSMSIGLLIRMHKILNPLNRKFAVYNTSDKLFEMADAINLLDLIPFYLTEEDLKE